MILRHYVLILIITFLFGSAYPVQKVIFNENVPPLLMGSLRMLVVFICLLPFWKFKIPDRKYWLPLFCFSAFKVLTTLFISIIGLGFTLISLGILSSRSYILGREKNKKWVSEYV